MSDDEMDPNVLLAKSLVFRLAMARGCTNEQAHRVRDRVWERIGDLPVSGGNNEIVLEIVDMEIRKTVHE